MTQSSPGKKCGSRSTFVQSIVYSVGCGSSQKPKCVPATNVLYVNGRAIYTKIWMVALSVFSQVKLERAKISLAAALSTMVIRFNIRLDGLICASFCTDHAKVP